MCEKLLRCIGSIGRESKNFKTSHRVYIVICNLTASVWFCATVILLENC